PAAGGPGPCARTRAERSRRPGSGRDGRRRAQMEYVLAALAGYFCGCLPVSSLTARHYGVDLHATGDHNPGAWNALEQLAARRAWPAFVGDGLKAFVPV